MATLCFVVKAIKMLTPSLPTCKMPARFSLSFRNRPICCGPISTARKPKRSTSASAYTYAYATLGELIAWSIGWDLIIEYAVGNVAVSISWGNYFKTLISGFGITVPDWMSTDYRTAARIPGLFDRVPHLFGVPIVFNFLAFAIVALITIVLVIGIRESATMNTTMVLLKLVVLGCLVAVGWSYVKPANFHPLLPNGWAGVQAGAAIVFFAYIGFDAVSTVAEETRRPSRDLPIGIIGSLLISTVIYILVAAIFIV